VCSACTLLAAVLTVGIVYTISLMPPARVGPHARGCAFARCGLYRAPCVGMGPSGRALAGRGAPPSAETLSLWWAVQHAHGDTPPATTPPQYFVTRSPPGLLRLASAHVPSMYTSRPSRPYIQTETNHDARAALSGLRCARAAPAETGD
jgi:hypothetical protein